jgi:hypothetical protein
MYNTFFKAISLSFILCIAWSTCFTQIPPGYYSSASGLTGNALKNALNDIIDGHIEFPYSSSSTDVWDILKETDKDTIDPSKVSLLYSGWMLNAAQEYDSGNGWNREHVWAKSHGNFGTAQGPGTDVHALRPTDISVNGARGNRWFDNGDLQYIDGEGATDWGVEDAGIPHGTQVAGIIGAKRNNSIGISGIAGGDGSDTTGCSLIDFKSPFLTPSNVSYRLAGVVDAARSAGSYFDYADQYHSGAENDYYFDNTKGFGVHIGNHSYYIRTILPLADQEKVPDPDSTGVIDVSECNLCREAFLFSLQNGVINVVARGNSGILNSTYNQVTSVEGFFPQSLPDGWIVSVGASGYDGNTVESGVNQSISEQNSDFYSLYGGNMDLVAPGSDSIVYSTLTTNVSGLYRKFNGTSAAAPHASGGGSTTAKSLQ